MDSVCASKSVSVVGGIQCFERDLDVLDHVEHILRCGILRSICMRPLIADPLRGSQELR